MNWTELDTWIVITGVLICLACALPGAFLVLHRQSMLGDGISHAVLPGLAIAFLLTNSRDLLPMVIGAATAGVLTAVLTQAIQRLGQVEAGAALGIAFCGLFAIGLILIRVASDRVDLDPDCVLYGSIETAVVDEGRVPRVALTSGGLLLVNALLTVLFYKELRLAAFDPALANTLGFNADAIRLGLTVVAAVTTVLSFESVGSILVIAMLVVPAATASLLTRKLHVLLAMALVFAALSAILGHIGAITLPRVAGRLLGQPHLGATSSAAMMAVCAGMLFLGAWLIGAVRSRRGSPTGPTATPAACVWLVSALFINAAVGSAVAGTKGMMTLTDPVAVPNQNLAPGKAVDLALPALPARPGHLLVLQFQAVVTSAGPAGCNYNAVVRFNGQDLGRFTATGSRRLLGRGAEFQLAGEPRTFPVFNGAGLMTMYAPSPEVGDRMTGDGLGATFVMDISDVARGVDGNSLTMRCVFAGPQSGTHGRLLVSGMQVGWLPRSILPIAPRQAPERGPVNQAVRVGRVTIAQSRCGGFVVKPAEGPELIVETALAMQADAPAALIADDTPAVKAGTQVSSKPIGRSGFTLAAAWPGLKMERSLEVRDGLVCWTEIWTNTSAQPQGVPFRHRFFFRQGETRILAGGCSDLGTVVNSPSNPTLFLQTPDGAGAGVVCESDWLRLLSGFRCGSDLGEIYTQWLGLPPGGRIQFDFTITPVAQGGYWSFINGLRRRWGMNTTTMARPLFFGYARAPGRTEDEILASSLGHLGPIYVAVNPWQRLEPDAKVITAEKFPRLSDKAPRAPGGSPDLDVQAFLTFAHREPYWASTGKEVEALHRVAPNVKVIQMVHPAMESIYKPMQDRWPIAADGIKTIQGAVFEEDTYSKSWLGDMCAKGWGVLYYVPRPGSRQLQAILEGVIRGLDQYHLDGIYSDEFSWAGLQRGYSRYDYSRSDGYSADLDETGKVLRFKSDNAHTTEAAQQAVIAEVRKRGGFFLGNGGNVLRSIFAQPIQRFVEGGNGPNYFPQGHLSAVPLLLGNMGTEKDTTGVFGGVKTCLAHGSIYSPGAVNLLLKGDDNFVCKQYPITIQEIGPGWVVGNERIITTVSRSFSWPAKAVAVKLYRYDRNGARLAGDTTVRVHGAQPLSLVVPDGGLVIAEL